jgi:hypothetical protein
MHDNHKVFQIGNILWPAETIRTVEKEKAKDKAASMFSTRHHGV